MNLRDAETGKVLWQGTEDLSVPGVEHEGMSALLTLSSHICCERTTKYKSSRPVYQMVYPLIHNETHSSHKPTLSANTDCSIYAVSFSLFI